MSPREPHFCSLPVTIDRSQRRPVGRQLEEQLRDIIRSGRLAGGSKLPATRTLAEDLGVSRSVVARIYGQLAAEGYLSLRRGANAVVRDLPSQPITSTEPAPSRRERSIRYDLHPDLPEVSAFPRKQWLRSLRHAVTVGTDADFGYISSGGLDALRQELAAYLARVRGVAAEPENVLVTAGTTHSVSLIARLLARRGLVTAAFENPSHRLLHEAAERSGVQLIGIDVDPSGLQAESIEETGASALFVSSGRPFPFAGSLSRDRRMMLVRWARESGALIIDVDYNSEFRYEKATAGGLHALAPEQVAYIGSTNCTLGPAIRLGWAVLPSRFIASATQEIVHTLGHVSGIEQLAFANFLQRGELDRHLRKVTMLYVRRRAALREALSIHVPHLRTHQCEGSVHLVLELPSSEAEAAAQREALARGLALQTVSEHALPGYKGPSGLLIGYGHLADPAIPDVVATLVDALDAAGLTCSDAEDACVG